MSTKCTSFLLILFGYSLYYPQHTTLQKPCSPTILSLSENFYSDLSFLTSNKSFHLRASEIYLLFIPY
nr:MAG TPA_asm: hypothetical protein [Bacteriophage sp.]